MCAVLEQCYHLLRDVFHYLACWPAFQHFQATRGSCIRRILLVRIVPYVRVYYVAQSLAQLLYAVRVCLQNPCLKRMRICLRHWRDYAHCGLGRRSLLRLILSRELYSGWL